MLKIYIYWHKCWCNGCGTDGTGQVKIGLLSFWSVNRWVSQWNKITIQKDVRWSQVEPMRCLRGVHHPPLPSWGLSSPEGTFRDDICVFVWYLCISMIFVYFCDIFGQVWAPPLQTRLAVTPVVIGTLRHPSRPSISWLECHWRLVELFPDPAHQLPRHPDCLTILKER